MAKGLSYKDAGVDIDVGNQLARGFTAMMQSTFGPQVLRNDMGFGGLYSLAGVPGLFSRDCKDPVLVAGADGVGTKLKLAFLTGKHDTVGIDLVAMSVNDILVQGAEPLFFLDYIGTGRCEKGMMLDVVEGIAEGCRRAGCALLGGETAEMPGFYPDGEYDLAGFAVGIVDHKRLIDGSAVTPGDVILGLPSSGLHSNGYSLARKALLEVGKLSLDTEIDELGRTLGEEMLEPTRIYVKPVLEVLRAYKRKRPVHGLVHITGGGVVENVPRILPKGCGASFVEGSWPVPPIFDLIRKRGKVAPQEMRRVFNMGLGLVMIVAETSADAIEKALTRAGETVYRVGRVVTGRGAVKLVKS